MASLPEPVKCVLHLEKEEEFLGLYPLKRPQDNLRSIRMTMSWFYLPYIYMEIVSSTI